MFIASILLDEVYLFLLTSPPVSALMKTLASSHIPAEFLDNIELINEDFMSADLELRSYDLILCPGALAHVDSPGDVIAKIASLLKHGGSVIVHNSNSHHPIGYLFNLYSKLRNTLIRAPYPVNQLSDAKLMEMFGTHGLKLIGLYRYSLPIRGMARFISSDSLYKLLSNIYGTYTDNYRAWLGSEYLYYLKKEG